MLSAATLGLGSIDQAEPFQFSMKLCGGEFPLPLIVPDDPTPQHWVALGQEMLLRIAPIDGLGEGTDAETSVQEDPSQDSIRIPDAVPVWSVVAPDAQQSVALTHSRPLRYPPSGLGSVTLGTIDHVAPSQ